MKPTRAIESWGRFPLAEQTPVRLAWRDAPLPTGDAGSLLPHGLGRSYGDSCLNDGATVLLTGGLDRFIAFDRATGVLRCESGVTLADILSFAVPQGWMLPVVPGTKFVTVGGAIANDVHGKNHHRAGTFGRHVRAFELVRSDGTRRICTPTEHAELYGATIGGLGLTGLITWAEIQLRPIASPLIASESIKFGSLDEFLQLNEESERSHEYTVSWIDCLAQGRSLGRGHYIRGNHAPAQIGRGPSPHRPLSLAVPFTLPDFTINPLTVRAFNTLYYHRQLVRLRRRLVGFDPFFFPLDGVLRWNRIYGRPGFFQYQFVVPLSDSAYAIRELLQRIARSAEGSFLVVLKTFGDVESPGWLSFPRPGITLAVDFRNRGEKTHALFRALDEIVMAAGGRIYPAKDARMSGALFRQTFPRWSELARHVDPRFSSSFWRRVTPGDGS